MKNTNFYKGRSCPYCKSRFTYYFSREAFVVSCKCISGQWSFLVVLRKVEREIPSLLKSAYSVYSFRKLLKKGFIEEKNGKFYITKKCKTWLKALLKDAETLKNFVKKAYYEVQGELR